MLRTFKIQLFSNYQKIYNFYQMMLRSDRVPISKNGFICDLFVSRDDPLIS